MIRDRIKELRRIKGSDLLPNPKNWRTHSKKQRAAMDAVLRDVGFAGAALARETSDGVQLIDGHLRAEILPDQEIPVLITDLDEAEANEVLATYDPIGALADANARQFSLLLDEMNSGEEAIQELIGNLAKKIKIVEPEPPADFQSYDENIEVEYTCPKCGYEWSGQPK